MNFLNAEIPDTDSSDDDYIPPPQTTINPPPLTIRKTNPPPFSKTPHQTNAVDDDDDDDDDEEEEEEEDEEFDPEEFRQQAALLARTAGPAPTHLRRGAPFSGLAGPSSFAPTDSASKQPRFVRASSAAGSSGGAGPSRAGAGPSGSGAGPSRAGAGPSGGNGVSEGGGAGNGGVGVERGDGGEVGREVQQASGVEKGGEGREESKSASAIDDIWAEMNRGSRASANLAEQGKREKKDGNEGLMGWLGGQPAVRRESKPFKVKLLGELEEEARKKEMEEERRNQEANRPVKKTGLEVLLSSVKGEKGDGGVLMGTRRTWDDFKKKDEGVEEELEKYKKDKDRYTERVAFLQRTDVREWEYEQAGKRRRR